MGKDFRKERGGLGRFLNPDNAAFKRTLNSKIYVDKTEFLDFTNQMINTNSAFICNSSPRRFGDIFIVGITYDKKDKTHKCKIEKDKK